MDQLVVVVQGLVFVGVVVVVEGVQVVVEVWYFL